MKKMLSLFLSLSMIFSLSLPAYASSNIIPRNVATVSSNTTIDPIDTMFNNTASAIPDATYGDFVLTWKLNGKYALLETAMSDLQNVEYSYNESGQRISKKVNGVQTSFSYGTSGLEFGKVVYENRDGTEIYYTYGISNYDNRDVVQPSYFEVDNHKYYFEFDGGSSVTGLRDENDELIVRYTYRNGIVTNIYQKDSDGEWIDVTNDPNSIGNVNSIRYCGYYFDKETQWYYCGRFYDSINERFIDNGINVAKENLLISTIAVDLPSALVNESLRLYDSSISNPSFGRPITNYTSQWFSGLSDMEILTRLIYGENTSPYRKNDRKAVGWIVMNRIESSFSSFATQNDVRTVCTAPNQFEAITGGSANTANARCPDTSSDAWFHAASIASCIIPCMMYGASRSDYLAAMMSKPTGISNQLFFTGLSYFKGVYQVNSSGALTYCFGPGTAYVAIKQVVVPDVNTNITTKSEIDAISSPNSRNIFFNIR